MNETIKSHARNAEAAAHMVQHDEGLDAATVEALGRAIRRSGTKIRDLAPGWEVPVEPPVEPPTEREVVTATTETIVSVLNAAAKANKPVLVKLTGSARLEVGLNRPGTKVGVDVPLGNRLDAVIQGGVLLTLLTGDRYLGGQVDHGNPPIKRLEFWDMTLDQRTASTYPVVTGMNTAAGTFGFKRIKILTTGGVSSKVLTPIRGNAAAAYEVEDIDCPDGSNEYVVYLNYGPGKSWVKNVRGRNNGRGIVQCVYRTLENYFAGQWASELDELVIDGIKAIDNGGKDGSNAVSIAGWGGGLISVRNLDVQTKFNAGGLAIVHDAKQHDVTGTPGNWKIVGPGFMLPLSVTPEGEPVLWAHNRVVVDLAGSTINNGNITAGSPGSTSSRPQIELESIFDLQYAAGTYGGKGPGPKIHNIGTQGPVEPVVVP